MSCLINVLMGNLFTKLGCLSLILSSGLGIAIAAKAETKIDPLNSALDSEAKVIEKLKTWAASQEAIAKPATPFPNSKINNLEKADRFLSPTLERSSATLNVNPVSRNVKLVLKLSDRRVVVYEDSQVKASYPVAVGKSGWETPKGKFQVKRLERNPTWQSPWTNQIAPPGDNSPIGARWIGFWSNGKDEIGFHGTPNEGSIGQAASHGCVRMLNRDVKALFEMVSIGTPVEVIP
jgi:L,D-transpeptidase ErfK/SrfK